MIEVRGIWIPESETWLRAHLNETPGYADMYDAELVACAAALPRRRVAIDVGANIGLWSRKLADLFDVVGAFEPLPLVAACFRKNTMFMPNVILHCMALGERNGTTRLHSHSLTTTFKTFVSGRFGDTPLCTLDSLAFPVVDFIKIDCEGYDYQVLRGAEETILRCRPAVLFEAKPGVSLKRYGTDQESPRVFLEGLGYVVTYEQRGNYFCQPREAL